MDRRLASIDGNLTTIVQVFLTIADARLPDRGPKQRERSESPSETPIAVPDMDLAKGQWMTRKEAWTRLGIVKSTLEGMLESGELASYRKESDAHKRKPRIWLKRSEVEELYQSYTLRKGKEKK